MSHTTKIRNSIFLHDSDVNATTDIKIIKNNKEIELSFYEIRDFVFKILKDKKIRQIEQMSDKEVTHLLLNAL